MTSPRSAVQPAVTRQAVIAALARIPADVDRDTWVRVGMALKSQFGSDGYELFDDWSARGETYDRKAARATWRSFKASGRVTIGSLFGIAKDHGFRFEDLGAGAPVPDVKAIEAARRKRQEQDAANAAQYRERAEKAARVAADMWSEALEDVASPYLERKGVGRHGVRSLPDGTLLVPMRDRDGKLHNLQRIAPKKPANDQPEKRFLAGGRKSGLWHWCGDPAGAGVLLIAEGYATAASLHEATGWPVAVAFDATNLPKVAEQLAEVFPSVPLIACGDDDRETEQRSGKNPGRSAAMSAARRATAKGSPAGVAFPEGLPAGGTDFNDLATHAGPAAVRAILEAARAELAAAGAGHAATDRQAPGWGAGDAIGGPDDAEVHPTAAEAPGPAVQAAAAPNGRDPFSVDDTGVWFTEVDAEGHPKKPRRVCDRLEVTALTRRGDDKNGWGYLLEFRDPDGNPKTWAMPAALLSGDGSEWAGRLLDMGLRIAPGARAKVQTYIQSRDPAERVVCTDRVGWHGSAFVLPSGSIGSGDGAQRYVLQTDSGMEDPFRRHGTLEEWQRQVAALCVGNSRLIFALCCALAGPMLRPAGMEGGGFHLRGHSGIGKTTGLKVAASVWGRPSYMQRWRTTDNALEATAAQHSDATLILDEIGEIDGRVLGECAYMLANGQEKGRATRGGMARRKRSWLLLFLSSGEVTLPGHMAEAGKQARAGMEVRMLDVPLDAGKGMGGIEDLHGHEGPAQLSEAIVAAAARCYGSAGRAWLEWACAHHAKLELRLAELVARYRDEMLPEASAEQVRRACNRFALVAAAGELATEAGITGWAPGAAAWGVRQCFNAWLGARGHLDNGEDAAMLRQVRQFLELNGEGRFTWWHRAVDDHSPKTPNRAGFRRILAEDGKPVRTQTDHQREFGERMPSAAGEGTQVEYFVLQEVFRSEVCRGFDHEAVAKLLQRRGHLAHEAGRLSVKARLPGMGNVRCYQLRPTLFDDEL